MFGAFLGPMAGIASSIGTGLFGNDTSPQRAPEMTPVTWNQQRIAELNRDLDARGIHNINDRIAETEAAIAGERVNDPRFAEHHLAKLPGIGQEYYNPFIQQGQQAQGLASEQYNRMTSNPMDYLGNIVESYRPSQGYQFREKRATDAARNAAAAGGLTGTYNDQASQAELVNNLLGADMQQYLQNVLGIQGAGLTGQENAINRGFNASGNLADYLGNAVGAQAGLGRNRELQSNQNALDYQNAQQAYDEQENQQIANLIGSIFGGIGAATGGGGMGGGMGGGAGGGLGGGMGNAFGSLFGGGAPAGPSIGNARTNAMRQSGNSRSLPPMQTNFGRLPGVSVYGGGRG